MKNALKCAKCNRFLIILIYVDVLFIRVFNKFPDLHKTDS